jgi:hypothetical protein
MSRQFDRHFVPVLLLTCLFLLVACGGKRVPLTASTTVPAATATADLHRDKNGNTVLELRVKHLAKPENLSPPKSVYVVWIQPTGSNPIKEGQLQVNNNLDAEFRAPTTYKEFAIFVTAEDNSTVQQPTGQEVLRSQVTGAR